MIIITNCPSIIVCIGNEWLSPTVLEVKYMYLYLEYFCLVVTSICARISVSISACHADEQGSTPWHRDFFF